MKAQLETLESSKLLATYSVRTYSMYLVYVYKVLHSCVPGQMYLSATCEWSQTGPSSPLGTVSWSDLDKIIGQTARKERRSGGCRIWKDTGMRKEGPAGPSMPFSLSARGGHHIRALCFDIDT